jgi:small subunit ribosomal protein S16
MFRVVVQDARRTPTSGKIVARLGSYDPHAKTATLDKEKASFYLEHGAQPSDRAAVLLKKEGVKLPKWVQAPDKKESTTRNPEKRRSTRPDEPAPAEEAPAAEPETTEAPETPAPEAPAEEPAAPETEAEPASDASEPAEAEAAEDKPEKPAEQPSEDEKPEETNDAPAEDAKPADEAKKDEDKS